MQYRLAAFSGATVAIFWALIEVVVISVFFNYGANGLDTVNGMSLPQAVTYIWIAQIIMGLGYPNIDGDLMAMITSGDVGVELCRPLGLYTHWFARTAASKSSAAILRGSLTMLCGVALTLAGFTDIGLGPPQSPAHLILFILSVFNSFIFGTAFSMMMTSVRLGVPWGDGPINLITMAGMVMSGAYFPLQLWPDFMQPFLRAQPFAGYMDAPARLYAGTVAVGDGLVSILFQFVWIAAFILAGKIIMERKLKNVIIQGG